MKIAWIAGGKGTPMQGKVVKRKQELEKSLAIGHKIGFLNGLTNGFPAQPKALDPAPEFGGIEPLGHSSRGQARMQGRFEKLQRKHLKGKRFMDLTLEEIEEIRRKIGKKKKQDDADETLLRRLRIAELVLRNGMNTEEFKANPHLWRDEVAELEREFEEGRHLFEVHDPSYASEFKKTLWRINFLIAQKLATESEQATKTS